MDPVSGISAIRSFNTVGVNILILRRAHTHTLTVVSSCVADPECSEVEEETLELEGRQKRPQSCLLLVKSGRRQTHDY
jgi:hypothetical protein